MAKKILIVGNSQSQHLNSLTAKVKLYAGDSVQLDLFDTSSLGKAYPVNSAYNRVFYCQRSFPSIIYKIPILSSVVRRVFDLRKAVRKINTQYDLINIHYVTLDAYFIWSGLKKMSHTIMVSPWGSDVYRVKKSIFYKVKNVFDKSSYVSAPKIKFRQDIKEIFKVDENKLVDLGFGSDVIDNLIRCEDITREQAKEKLQLKDHFIITCGYNGSELQNHIRIIEAINQARNDLSEKLFLILPMTYGGSTAYINQIEQLLFREDIPHRILRDFLSDEEMVYLRKCSDMFIHAQPTDAFSGSVQEYILTDTKVINSSKTRYPDLEKFEMPYFLFNDFDELGKIILEVSKHSDYKSSVDLKQFISQQGWDNKGRQWAEFYRNVQPQNSKGN